MTTSVGANDLRARRVGVDTYQEPVIYMHADCSVCRSEGFTAQSRVNVSLDGRSIDATLNVVHGEWLQTGEAGLSEVAWRRLGAAEGVAVHLSHAAPRASFGHVRAKLYGHELQERQLEDVVADIAGNRYTDIQLSAFLTACTGNRLDLDETVALTRAMVEAGQRLRWPYSMVMDKHCVGGLPGNRTTPLIVAIVAASGLPIPKTSSRAITSPAGTADTMATLTRVDLDMADMRDVVEQENGCLVWGGAVDLSPADDVLIRVERALDIDSDAQLVASVLSKKIAAGATHAIIDMPVGPTAKIRDDGAADSLARLLTDVGEHLGLHVSVIVSDGKQPVGRGIGPALEARDVLSVLQDDQQAPDDLANRAIELAGRILEIGGAAQEGCGSDAAAQILASGKAWQKFQAICTAQGGLREPPTARHLHIVPADREGCIEVIDNRRLARVAKLAGAPGVAAAGIELHARLGARVSEGQPLFSIHSDSKGELAYALTYLNHQESIFEVVESE